MSLQKSFTYSVVATGTTVILASGGMILNAFEITLFGAVVATPGIFIQDNFGATLVSRQFIILAANTTDKWQMSGLNIPTTVNGGLAIVLTGTLGAGNSVSGTIYYTVP